MKYEWRKKEKQYYLPKAQPEIIEIPEFNFLSIEGEGHPGGDGFSKSVEALYSVSYGLKMTLKSQEGFYDYTVYPLEGEWDLTDEGKEMYLEGIALTELKEHFKYKLMIRQPDFVTNSIFEDIRATVLKKKKSDFVKELVLEKYEEGLACQLTHIGSYDNEPESFKLMDEFINDSGYVRLSKEHREIYISDPRRVDEAKMKTVLRYIIKKSE